MIRGAHPIDDVGDRGRRCRRPRQRSAVQDVQQCLRRRQPGPGAEIDQAGEHGAGAGEFAGERRHAALIDLSSLASAFGSSFRAWFGE